MTAKSLMVEGVEVTIWRSQSAYLGDRGLYTMYTLKQPGLNFSATDLRITIQEIRNFRSAIIARGFAGVKEQ